MACILKLTVPGDRRQPCGRCVTTRRECTRTGLRIRQANSTDRPPLALSFTGSCACTIVPQPADPDLQRTSPRNKSVSKHQDDVCSPFPSVLAATDKTLPVDFIDETRVVANEVVEQGAGLDDGEADQDSPSGSEDDNSPAPHVLTRTTSASSNIFDPSRSPTDRFIQRDWTSPPRHRHGTSASATPSLDRREIQDPKLRDLMKDVYLDIPMLPLSDLAQARLLRHFVENLSKWVSRPVCSVDVSDARSSSTSVIRHYRSRLSFLTEPVPARS